MTSLTSAQIEQRLSRVLAAVHGDSGAEDLLRRRVAVAVVLSQPEAAVRVDGRDGQAAGWASATRSPPCWRGGWRCRGRWR